MQDIDCPFCKENGFDMIGLKNHLLTYCHVFEATISPERESWERRQDEMEATLILAIPAEAEQFRRDNAPTEAKGDGG